MPDKVIRHPGAEYSHHRWRVPNGKCHLSGGIAKGHGGVRHCLYRRGGGNRPWFRPTRAPSPPASRHQTIRSSAGRRGRSCGNPQWRSRRRVSTARAQEAKGKTRPHPPTPSPIVIWSWHQPDSVLRIHLLVLQEMSLR